MALHDELLAQAAQQPMPSSTIVLPNIDLSGKRIDASVVERDGPAQVQPRKRQKPANLYDKDGQRTDWFEDDRQATLDDLVAQQRRDGAEDYDKAMAANIAGNRRYQDAQVDEGLEGHDIDTQMIDNRQRRLTQDQIANRERQRLIREHKIVQDCALCFEGARRQRYLTASVGERVYLALPRSGGICDGHMLIVPKEHTASSTQADEDLWEEIKMYQLCLVRMFASLDHGVVFMETATGIDRHRHMVIECVPLERELFLDAPIFFQKAILESDDDWTHNKKLVDTTAKGLRGSVPPNFPYFWVKFGNGKGFAHVIENLAKFPAFWGLSVVGGIMGLPSTVWTRPKTVAAPAAREQIEQFRQAFAPFDWTQQVGQQT